MYLIWAAIGLAFDQAAKYLFLKNPVLEDGVFLNKNFAWGLPISNGLTFGLMILAMAVLIFIVARSKKSPSLPVFFILSGAISNIIDRIFRHGVVDYIYVPWGGIINIADVLIFIGVILLIFKNKIGTKDSFN